MKKVKQKALSFLLFFAFLPGLVLAQETLTGKTVEQSTGNIIPFVNVVEKGTSNGTTSDMNGEFSLSVDELPTTLRFTYLGYKSQYINVTSSSPLTVSFIESAAALEEVVITGLATSIKRSNAANAVFFRNWQEGPLNLLWMQLWSLAAKM